MILNCSSPTGAATVTVSPTLWPLSAKPNGLSSEMQPSMGLASCEPTIVYSSSTSSSTSSWNAPGLPEYALGFVYLPALVGIVAVSMFTAPIGAGIAHKLPIPRLKKFFACFLYVVAAKMLMDVL